MLKISASGGKKSERELAKSAVSWGIKELGLSRFSSIQIGVKIKELGDYCGSCEELAKRSFSIEVDNTQDLTNFIMTIMHEMVHVKQYVRNKWDGDGEKEAWEMQAGLTKTFINEKEPVF